jgi:sugar phosphate isomerase/epimerase
MDGQLNMDAEAKMEIGVMFWVGRDDLAEIRRLGVSVGQLGIGDQVELTPAFAEQWQSALASEQFRLATVVAAYAGEDYADIPTVQRTVGFIPQATREERERRTLEVSDFAKVLGVGSIACHIGFVPEDRGDPDYAAVRDVVRRVCDHAEYNGQTFALETGQEPAGTLLEFLRDCERPNLKINFDPANMILYGTGDPIDAFERLAPQVVSVHAKDGDWPPKDRPGSLGTERPLGEGSVGIERFVDVMRRCGYRGTVNIEREIADQTQRLADIGAAVELLRRLMVS